MEINSAFIKLEMLILIASSFDSHALQNSSNYWFISLSFNHRGSSYVFELSLFNQVFFFATEYSVTWNPNRLWGEEIFNKFMFVLCSDSLDFLSSIIVKLSQFLTEVSTTILDLHSLLSRECIEASLIMMD